MHRKMKWVIDITILSDKMCSSFWTNHRAGEIKAVICNYNSNLHGYLLSSEKNLYIALDGKLLGAGGVGVKSSFIFGSRFLIAFIFCFSRLRSQHCSDKRIFFLLSKEFYFCLSLFFSFTGGLIISHFNAVSEIRMR